MRSRHIAATLAFAAFFSALFLVGGGYSQAAPERSVPFLHASVFAPGNHDVIVQLFEWPWASVAFECTSVLGPKGFGGVQVSPPQEHVVLPSKGYPWWQDYQPVSYQLLSRRGDRTAFADMVRTCHGAGVKVFVDAVINHMAGGASSGLGSAGSSYSHYSYPAVPYGDNDFHHCGRNGNDDIANWQDRWEVQNCELVDLSDLKTESSYVRSKLDGYLDDLVSLGVDGFRVDAAKHIPVGDLSAIMGAVPGSPYVYQEVIEGGNGEISPTEYTGIGDVTEFRYGDVVGDAFRNGSIAGLNQLEGRMLLSSADAITFIDNHDTQRNGRAKLTYKDGSSYALAEAFMIAYPYGVPKVMSSFDFTNPESSPPAAGNGTTLPVSCGQGWVCEHRWRTTENMVGLRNAAAGAAVTNWWSNGNDQIAFGRGSKAFVAFNRSGTPLARTFQTSLPLGTYCDVMNGDPGENSCTGPAYTVDGSGRVNATVPPNGALGLHVDARTSGVGCTMVSTSIAATAYTHWGQNVFVVGNTPALGNWAPANGVALSPSNYPVWTGTVAMPPGTTIEYKYIKRDGDSVVWESDPNRVRTTPGQNTCSTSWTDTWR
jgi:alpha-amylase